MIELMAWARYFLNVRLLSFIDMKISRFYLLTNVYTKKAIYIRHC